MPAARGPDFINKSLKNALNVGLRKAFSDGHLAAPPGRFFTVRLELHQLQSVTGLSFNEIAGFRHLEVVFSAGNGR